MSRASRVDWLVAIPLLVPGILVAAGNDAFGFDPPGWLDSFMFLGNFWHYREHLWLFDQNSSYKISRLPWVLPGTIAHALFPPVTAAVLLAYASLASAAVALYLHVRDALNDRFAAAFVSVLFACCTGMHAPGGWYYHVLAATGYYLWACWMLVRAASATPSRGAWAAGAGACFAAAVTTHLFLAVFTPLLVVLFWGAIAADDESRTSRWRTSVAFGIAGGVGLIGALAIVNRITGGAWLFFLPQIELAFRLSQKDPWWLPTEQWLPNASYLVLPIAFALTGLLAGHRVRKGDDRINGTLAVLPWLAIAITCIFQFWTRETTLDYDYMAFVLYLHALPAAGTAISFRNGQEARSRWTLLAVTIGIMVLPLLVLMPAILPGLMNQMVSRLGLTDSPLIVLPLLFSLLGVVVTWMVPRPGRAVAMAVWFSMINGWLAPQPSAYGIHTPGTRRAMLETFREADSFVHDLDPSLIGIKYWLSSETLPTPQGPLQSQAVFDSFLATRVWLTNLFARNSPGLPIETLTLDHVAAAPCVAILSSEQAQASLAEAMMAHYARLGRPLIPVADRQFRSRGFAFALTVLRPVSDAGDQSAGAPPCAPADRGTK